MLARLASLLIWAVVAASAVYWGMKMLVRPQAVPAHAAVAQQSPPQGGDWNRVFGAPPPKPAASTAVAAAVPADARFKLLGVVAPKGGTTAQGLAVISVDGKPARAVAAGQVLDGQVAVLAVHHRKVELGARGGPAQMVLELAPLAEPARGGKPQPNVPVQPPPPVLVPGRMPGAAPPGVASPVLPPPPAVPAPPANSEAQTN